MSDYKHVKSIKTLSKNENLARINFNVKLKIFEATENLLADVNFEGKSAIKKSLTRITNSNDEITELCIEIRVIKSTLITNLKDDSFYEQEINTRLAVRKKKN